MQHQEHVATAGSCLTTVLEQLQAGAGLDMVMGNMSSSCGRVVAGMALGELLAAVMHA